jgi:hypothetical protein
MKPSGLPFITALLILTASNILACGGSMFAPHANGSIKSITISPATADAQDYPGGKVQFIATGYYNAPPSPVSPLSATWGACYQNAPTSGISVSSNGLAQCTAGSVGTYTVFAYDFPNPSCLAITACGGGCTVEGTAQLICP